MKIQEVVQPELYEMMCDCDTNRETAKKRLRKSMDNSLNFLDRCSLIHGDSKVRDV